MKSARALQAAEKLNRAVGRGFIPGIKPMESMGALAPEVCFSGILPENQPFSAASLAPLRYAFRESCPKSSLFPQLL
jgi:hypothetical protein